MKIYKCSKKQIAEDSTCKVVALSIAWGVPYDTAQSWLEKRGRKSRCEFSLISFFRMGPHKEYKQFKKRGVSWHNRPGMSVGEFKNTHPNGVYICKVDGHVYPMVDGVLYNQKNMDQLVHYYFYVSPEIVRTRRPEQGLWVIENFMTQKNGRLYINLSSRGKEYTMDVTGTEYEFVHNNPGLRRRLINEILAAGEEAEDVLLEVCQREESFCELLYRVMKKN